MTNSLLWICLGLVLCSPLTLAFNDKCVQADQFECVGYMAFCDGPNCVCEDGYHGRSFLGCHNDSAALCTIFNDPKGKTLGREPVGGIDIPLPCKYLLADVSTETGIAKCDYKIFAAEERGKGKFFVSTFEVVLSYEQIGVAFGQFSARVHVTRSGGELISYVLRTRNSNSGPYGPDDSLADLNAGLGGLNLFAFNFPTQSAFISIERCGLVVIFRAADDLNDGKSQPYLPGLSIGIDEDGFDVDYNLLNETFCLTSDKNTLTVGDVANMLDMKEDHAFIYRALIGGYEQDSPNIATAECEAIFHTATNCTDQTDRMKAFEECDFIWDKELFVNCYSDYDDSRDLITLFDNCIEAYCQKDVPLCIATKAAVVASGCMHHATPEFAGFDCTML